MYTDSSIYAQGIGIRSLFLLQFVILSQLSTCTRSLAIGLDSLSVKIKSDECIPDHYD